MPYTLNSNVVRLFNELGKASDALDRRQAFDQLYALFDALIQIFNDIERNSDLLTSSAISLMKEKDTLADHQLFFTDCYAVFKGHPNELFIYDLLAELSLEYDLLIHQYDEMLDDLSPSKELTLKELRVLLQDVYSHFKTTQHKDFLNLLVWTIEHIKKLDDTPENCNYFNCVDLRENLNTLLLLAPLQIKDEIEKINSQIILHYEILNFRLENPLPQLPTEKSPVIPELMISSFAFGLLGLGFFAALFFLMQLRRKDDPQEVSEGYCSSSYHM